MQKAHGKNNEQSIFGVHQIPSANPIRNLLDPIPPETVFGLLRERGDSLHAHGYFAPFRSMGDTLLVARDGTDFFSWEKISCPCCSCQPLKNGKTLYRHRAVTPVIVAPGQAHVVPWPPEFIQPQEGQEKQDGELAAGKRWLNAWGAHDAPWRVTLLGDDLYCHQPFCEETIAQGFDLLRVCKPDSHSLLDEWRADFERAGPIRVVESVRKTGKHRLTERYRYMNRLPLRDSNDALMLNGCELTFTDDQGKTVYQNAWATTHQIHDGNVADIATAGRAR